MKVKWKSSTICNWKNINRVVLVVWSKGVNTMNFASKKQMSGNTQLNWQNQVKTKNILNSRNE